MRKIGAEVASGIAIFVAFIIFIFGFLYLKNVTFKSDSYELYIEFQDVAGLEPGDGVRVSGLQVGKVNSFKLKGLTVLVGIEVDPEIELPEDSWAQIKSLGMVGEKYIEIIPGNSENIVGSGDVLQGKSGGDLSDITGSMEGLIQQAEELLINVKAAFDNVFDMPTQRALQQSVHHLRNISSKLDENSKHMERTLANLDTISTSLNGVLANRRDQVESSIENVHKATTQFEHFSHKLDSTLTSMQNILAKIENQEGAVGKAIYKEELYNDVRDLTAELDELVKDVKKRPQRYIDMGFIKIF